MSYVHFATVERASRKARPCDRCGQGIAVGERYTNETGVYDGDFQNHHMHPECHSDMLDLARDSFGDCTWVTGENPRPTVAT